MMLMYPSELPESFVTFLEKAVDLGVVRGIVLWCWDPIDVDGMAKFILDAANEEQQNTYAYVTLYGLYADWKESEFYQICKKLKESS